jgi:DGQHR domain-containing protein
VHQWLAGWEKIEFVPKAHRRKPEPNFLVFSLPAVELRSLCGISRRQTTNVKSRSADLGIQRQHDRERSEEIAQFVAYGYPWSTLSEAKRTSQQFFDLRKPGWLPTAIVVNILTASEERNSAKVSEGDLIAVESRGGIAELVLPYEKWSRDWRPSPVPPMEVIDGQHRLWAFESDSDASFELPVVAFHGLDISWQAYLFWTINIKPKRINPSLAFDLYPLLRAEDWLDRAEGHPVYRETRSQELTEAIWSHPDSPWYDRINMLGEKKIPWVSQAAWVKSLMATFIRPWQGRGSSVGGLYGSRMSEGEEVLGWSRAQQAAFLLSAWRAFRTSVRDLDSGWAKYLRVESQRASGISSMQDDPAFYGPYSLIVTDQGVRGFLHVLNDICFVSASKLKLNSWAPAKYASANDTAEVSRAMESLEKHPVFSFLTELSGCLATFDWRASSTPRMSEEERRRKLVFRGSGGYKELRIQILEHLRMKPGLVGEAAKLLT